MFVYGDSLAVGTKPFMRAALPGWALRQDVDFSRPARSAASVLRKRGSSLAPVIYLSLGTVDDPTRPEAFRRAVRAVLRVAGPERCVIWPNIYRPSATHGVHWTTLNHVLAEEARREPNLVVIDWWQMVHDHHSWRNPGDGTHVDADGYRARAHAVAVAARGCLKRLASPG
jgi:hypothetical protein